jgi:hypothetical protein
MRLIKSKQFTTLDCQLPIRKSKIVIRKSSILMCWVAVLLLGILLPGCSTVSPGGGTQRFSYQQTLSAPYDQTEIKKSLTLDVLPKIQRSQDELGDDSTGTEMLSHSERVVASLGQSKDGYKTWFNMVSFHEYRLNVIRKYFFLVHDKAGSFQTRSKRGLRFDCEMVLDKQVLEKPYAAESARQIALLRTVLNNFREDINELSADTNAPGQSNEMLNVCGMLVNQTFETILLKLDSSPILATRLGQTGGFEFDHINFDLGTIQMTVEGDIVTVQIRLGAFADTI